MNAFLIELAKEQREKVDSFAKQLAQEVVSKIDYEIYTLDELSCLSSIIHSEASSRIAYEVTSEVLWKAKDFQ